MNKIEFINFEGVEIPLAIPVEMDLPKFVSDDEINPNTRRDLLFFNIIQEQLKTLFEDGHCSYGERKTDDNY